MNVQAEVSLYPLRAKHLSAPIARFCASLAKRGLRAEIGAMSASLSGELGDVFDGLKTAMAEAARDHEVVLVAKVSNACPLPPDEQDESRRPR